MVARSNPLIVLGIPQSVLVHAQAQGRPQNVLKVAEGFYKALAKSLHSDLGGDPVLMASFNEAIEEIRDPDALEYYISELVRQDDVALLRARRQQQTLATRDAQALTQLAAGYQFIDQFAALGITRPTTYLVAFLGERIVVDVLSTTEAYARTTHTGPTAMPPPLQPLGARYRSGIWSEAYLKGYAKRWQPYTDFVSREEVRVIGSIPPLSTAGKSRVVEESVSQALEGPRGQFRLNWEDPDDCWFLPSLRFAGEVTPQNTGGLVLYKRGRFAVTGTLLGDAPYRG